MRGKRMGCLLLCLALLAAMGGAAGAEPVEAAEKPVLVAHAGGAVYGFRLTNSLEAMNEAYANGFRVLELDLSLTSDGELVLLHDWESMARRMLGTEGQRSLADFLAADSFMDLTLLDGEGLLDWLEQHPDCRIITDVKEPDNLAVLTLLRERALERSQAAADAFIPQIYQPSEYEAVRALGYADIILTLYRMPEIDPYLLALFLHRNPCWGVTIPVERLEEGLTTALASGGATVYTHAVNDLSTHEFWREKGVYGIYTDYFQPAHWPEGAAAPAAG